MKSLLQLAGIAVLIGFWTGCASVNPGPFNDFAASVKVAQDGMNQAILFTQKTAHDTLVENFAADPASKFADVMILPAGGYQWKFAAQQLPLYLSLASAQAHLAQLNAVFAGYSGLLAYLASDKVGDPAVFDQMANDLNANALKLTSDAGGSQASAGIPILSAAASAAFGQFIERKKKSDLRAALVNNQETVAHYAASCVTLIHTLRTIVQSHYTETYALLSQQWGLEKNLQTPKAITLRRDIANQVLALDDSYMGSMGALQGVEAALAALPASHADLVKSLDGEKGLLPGLHALQASGEHLNQLYQQLKATSGDSS